MQSPLQPAKAEPGAGVALSVTEVPLRVRLEQSEPQLIPAGLLVTVPAPEPVLFTARVRVTGGGALVLTWILRFVDVVGFAAICDWLVTTSTREEQPAGSKLVSVRDWPVAATAGSGRNRAASGVARGRCRA